MPPSLPEIRRVLVTIDYGETADRALAWAAALTIGCSAEMLVLHVVEKPMHFGTFGYSDSPGSPELSEDHARLETHLRARLSDSGLIVQALVEAGDPAVKIREVARRENVDLIVMGTRGKPGLEGLLFSSLTNKVVHHTGCPVLAVPPPFENE